MESNKNISINTLGDFYAPNPYTERAYSTNISVSKDGKWMGYCVSNVVVIRSLEDFKTCKIFTGHKVKTTSVSFSFSNVFACSGDIEGNLKIWFLDDLSLKKEFTRVLSGKILGIEWNDDSNKLFVFGEGKTYFARCISWDTANNIGEISAHSKIILAGDMKKNRPYRIATGSEDLCVNFYEGTPFKFSKMHKEHTNFVTGVRYSPDNTRFVSCGFDKRIIVYDGKDSTVLFTLAQDKSENNHTAAIIGITWLDNSTIATCSLDKTVKVWNLDEKACKYTLYPTEKTKLDIPDSGCAVNNNSNYLFSLSLNGNLHFWKITELSDGKLPDLIIEGHQYYISHIIQFKTKSNILSSDFNGKIILWDDKKNDRAINIHAKKIIGMSLNANEDILYSLDGDGNVSSFDLNRFTLK
jgi:WD40 repeat protein